MSWQPIETAPRDGTPFIGLYWGRSTYERAGDIVRAWFQPEFEAFISSCREMQMHNGWTFGDGSTRSLHSPVIEEPNFWMPFEPPAEQSSGMPKGGEL
jgi:hypothetical protein